MQPIVNTQQRPLDIICLGRAAVDFYGNQVGSRLEDMGSFNKYLGGSSANIAYGCARLGLKSAMLTRVGDEHMGRFVREELSRAQVDVSHVLTDAQRLTGLVVLGIKDRDTFPLIFYRRDCADMAIDASDFTPEFIASSHALLITGTHFSTPVTLAASLKAIEYAKAAGVKVIVDIDYRPVLWGLTGLGDGETRFISSDTVSAHLQRVLPLCDLIVGTEEEIHIAGGSTDTIEALKKLRAITSATLVLKLGALGCTVFEEAIPERENDFRVYRGVTVEVLNVLGAGDAFMSGFLRGWLREESIERCCAFANACGALVVSRHGCAPAIPSETELMYYLENAHDIEKPDQDVYLNHLHRVTTRFPLQQRPEICALAFDHRSQLVAMAQQAGAATERIVVLKHLLVQAVERAISLTDLSPQSAGVLIDDIYGQAALNQVTGRGWWIGRPVELPGSRPLQWEQGSDLLYRLSSWPLEQVVKCLVFYHPQDEAALRQTQEAKIQELYRCCCHTGHQLLLEVILPESLPQDESYYVQALNNFYALGIKPDWWKLPAQSAAGWQALAEVIHQQDPYCQGIVLLGLGAELDAISAALATAAQAPVCKGFTVGRTLFAEQAQRWFAADLSDAELIEQVAQNYVQLIKIWRAERH